MDSPLRRRALGGATAWAALAAAGCHGGGSLPASTRTWRMGFSALPPRNTMADALRTIDLWSTRADLAAIHDEPPYTELLAGVSPDVILQRDKVGLVDFYRSKGMQLMYMADLTDGLDRSQEAPQLRALGRSLAEPAVQQAVRGFLLAVARLLRPEYLGLAPETNLIRATAPAALYSAVRRTANDAAADLRAAGTASTLFVSVQVETAWGKFTNGPFVGIDTDRTDFPFMQLIGLSSYPYLAYAQPEDIPDDHYRRLQSATSPLPMMVVEGGWPSASVGTAPGSVTSTPALQARYVTRHAALLDGIAARGWTQLPFTDIDPASFPQPTPPSLALFVKLGFVDTQFNAKPALAQWDALFGRPRA
ncbi:MAG: hypothetical protein HS128_16840 [Ideonella sp.]|nr:hypothetical protein [Ideonella sp.]MCC7456963.1 hypothetical protein [Nitrospira sp.]